MIVGLGRFVEALRLAGLAASPAEWLDALRAAELAGLDDRTRFRAALRCTLAKGAAQSAVFERVFEEFFAVGRAVSPRPREGTGRALVGRGGPNRRAAAEGPGHEARPRREVPTRPAALPTALGPANTSIGPRDGVRERRGRLRRVVLAAPGDPRRDGRSGERQAGSPIPPERQLLRRWLSSADEQAIAALVPRIVERIRLRSGRRLVRHPRGRLYLRRVFRDNLAHGGVPWILPRRRVRPRRARVVLLVDVSWSSARAAALFIAIAESMLARIRRARVLLFVDRVVDATSAVERWLDGSRGSRDVRPADAPAAPRTARPRPASAIVRGSTSFAQVLQSLSGLNLDAPSDYGRSFYALLRSDFCPAGRKTVLIVLGDGRTNRFDPQTWAFEKLASRCGTVLWLVPEEAARWGSGDSALSDYVRHVDVVVEARDVSGLARGVREMVRCL